VYIEGDGLAWLTRSQPSQDPTPRDPLALRLALAHAGRAAVYLARPCQFAPAAGPACPRRYWTSHRFAPEVIAATGRAVDALRRRAGATRLVLVGYSGGGAVAALVAARRDDVELLVTLAGNLDHRAWSAHHRVTPLAGSLSPADEIEALRRVRQVHLVGSDDTRVPASLVLDFVARFPPAERPRVEVEPATDHARGWLELWPARSRRLLEADSQRR